ncbi:MAG: hypothetical protein KKI08_04255 [Armatimonadetes bacterium]|nr:hypothetical protein [Armatimonadota bacterium]
MASTHSQAAAPPGHAADGLRLGRALLVAVPLALAGVWWIHQASLVQAPGQLYAPVYLLSVPPVPAVIFLFALASLSAAFGRRLAGRAGRPLYPRGGRRGLLSARELMVVYIVLVVAIPPTTFGIIEMLLPWTTAPSYFGTPQDGLDELAGQYFPGWMYPHDPEAIRTMFEGSEAGVIPWRPWAAPLAGWLGFVMLLFVTSLCLMTLFHRQWSEHERLRYPLLLLPLSVADPGGRHAEIRGLFRNPLTWIAIGLVAIHHALNVAHSYNPGVMALMDRYPVGKIFTEKPWTAFRGLTFFHRPQMVGFSYFVSVDVLFSGWFFFVFQMFIQMMADVFGYQAPGGFPFAAQQGSGAFVALFFALVWVAKGELWGMVRAAAVGCRGLKPPPASEASLRDATATADAPLPPAMALWGALGGFALIVAWCVTMKMTLGLALAYFGLLLGWAVVYARIRAEAGVASMWAFPFDQHPQFITAAVGTRGLIQGPDATQLVMLSVFSWLSRGYFPSMAGYVIENEKLAQETGVPARATPWLMILALLIGMLGGYYVTLKSYYDVGANVLHGGTTSGGYNVRSAMSVWNGVAAAIQHPGPPNTSQVLGSVAGGLVTLLLVVARRAWLRFPFHPLGYAMALNYGYALWGPFLLAWAIKLIIDRLGGAEWYRKMMPFFLGLAIGDLVAGGLLWIVMAVFGPDITNGYMVQFG